MIARPCAAALALLALASAARAENPYPTRSGETGFVEVPSAEVVGRGGAMMGAEVRYDHSAGNPGQAGPFPFYAVSGLGSRLEVGFSVRQGGHPGDEFPQTTAFGGALKLKLADGRQAAPSWAIDATADNVNSYSTFGSRLIASGDLRPMLRFGAFVGGAYEMPHPGSKNGVLAGAALALAHSATSESYLEGTYGPHGADVGLATRWRVRPTTNLLVGVDYLPNDNAFRVSFGVSFTPRRPIRPEEPAAAPPPAEEEEVARGFTDDRPRFRLKMHGALSGASGEPLHLQYGPLVAAAPGARTATATGPQLPAAASLDDLAEAQLREQEALAEARERRVTATGDQLDAREKAAATDAKRLDDLEKTLAAREKELDAREQRLGAKGPSSPQQRQLESLEAQLAAQERTYAAQERTYGPALEAARGREQDALARENAERGEATRLAAASGAGSRAQQNDVRRQALGARNRQLAAFEARLVARGERTDALERQLRARGERLDAWARRLDTRAERLALLESRTSEASPRPGAAPAALPAAGKAAAVVMVVKAPTIILKGTAAAPSAGPVAGGAAVEKSVAAATVVAFPTPSASLSELDGEAIDNIAKLAAKEKAEVLVWARAKDPSLMGEAQRRANDLKARVVSTGPVPDRLVVTRVTTRPGAPGVDVVVSALTSRPGAAAAPGAGTLEGGEGGKRQIREAVQAAQPLIEGCIGEHLAANRLPRAEGFLKLTITAKGRVQSVRAVGADLGSQALDACLAGSAARWQFPSADAEYSVEVPITVVQGGGTK